jgi:YegS/Rv2252/BmrU family lipid kinase
VTAGRTVAIVNPAAKSGGAATTWPAVETALRANYSGLEVRPTKAAGHATQLCRDALEQGAQLVISVGGDGTNNEVLCGFVDPDGNNRFPEATLGVVAAGTGGDFQRMFGVLAPAKQVKRMCEATPRTIDYGLAEYLDHEGNPTRRPFLNTASVGITGLVVRYVATASRSMGATMAYVNSSLKGILKYRNKQVLVRHDDGDEQRLDLTLTVVTNGQYFGAGMWACPQAELDDGLLDSLELTGMSRAKLVSTLLKVFKGKHLRVKGVAYSKVKRVEIRPVHADVELLVELDGEQPGRAPATFRVVPGALRVLVA